jgi:uncharacterized membrane protein
MTGLRALGRYLLLAGIAGFGLQALLCTAPVPQLEPLPAWLPASGMIANLSGLLLLALAAGLGFSASRRLAAWGLAVVLLLWAGLLHAPLLAAAPDDGGAWARLFITLALAGSALVLAGLRQGRLLFGLALIVFGAVHLIYRQAIAEMIPAWIPDRMWWPYLTGAANLAAGLALISGVKARLAGLAVGLMYLSWLVLIHVPAVVAAPHDPGEWNRLLVALALAGGAWVVSDTGLNPRASG